MLAGGSTKRIELSRSIENSGGILDFYTDHEHMMTTMDVLPEKLVEASFVISELLLNSDFEEEKFKQEYKIILNELAEASDDPAEKIEQLLLTNLFRENPVKRPVGRFPKTIKRLTLNQLSSAPRSNYVPQNMILILAGSFSRITADKILRDFGDRPLKGLLSKKTFPAETTKPKRLVVKKNLE